jgi:ABC-type phosphonate transport system ATPase subunit
MCVCSFFRPCLSQETFDVLPGDVLAVLEKTGLGLKELLPAVVE